MFTVCGEAVMELHEDAETPVGMLLDARIGGSPLNVAIGLARLGQEVDFLGALSIGFLGQRIARALQAEGVGLAYARFVKFPTALRVTGKDASASASHLYGEHCADRQLEVEHLPLLDDSTKALHFGSSCMVVEPVASTLRLLVERERDRRVISYAPDLSMSVEPKVARWASVWPGCVGVSTS